MIVLSQLGAHELGSGSPVRLRGLASVEFEVGKSLGTLCMKETL